MRNVYVRNYEIKGLSYERFANSICYWCFDWSIYNERRCIPFSAIGDDRIEDVPANVIFTFYEEGNYNKEEWNKALIRFKRYIIRKVKEFNNSTDISNIEFVPIENNR